MAVVSIICSFCFYYQVVDIDLKKFANISKWLEKAKSTLVGYQEANQKGADEFKAMVANLTKK